MEELFKPGKQSLENYDLRLAHQRFNAAYDKFLGENNVKAGIELFVRVKDEGYMEAVAWAACHVIRASLTLEKVSATRRALISSLHSDAHQSLVFWVPSSWPG